MPRRFNYTGRQKIRRADANIRLVGSGSTLAFIAELNLQSYKLDPQARVAVEAYRSRTASYRRFEYGYAGAITPPPDRSLADFQTEDDILFRVKVTLEQDGLGKLLAEADGIAPKLPDETDSSAKPLLPVASYDLGGETWRVVFDGNKDPVLVIDPKVPLGKQYATDPFFRAIAAPAILRQILVRTLTEEVLEDEEPDPDHWTSRWLAFARALAGKEPDDDDDQNRDLWIDNAVTAFARRGRFLDVLAAPPA